MGSSKDGLRRFSAKETALLLGISESYLSTLEREHTMVARRNENGRPVYTAVDIAILRKMGVGRRPGQLHFSGTASQQLGVYFFGQEPPPDDPIALTHAAKAKAWEEQELDRLRTIREATRRRWAREWKG